MASPNLLLPLFQAISSNQAAICSNVAALTILLYDCLLTFDNEVKYIWKSQWTIPKVLYLFAKYYGLAHLCCVLMVSNITNLSFKLKLLDMQTLPVVVHPVYAFMHCTGLVNWYTGILTESSLLAHSGEFTTNLAQAEFWGIYKSMIIETSTPMIDLDAVEFIIPDIKHSLSGCAFWETSSLNFNFTLESYVPNLFVSGVFFCLMAYGCSVRSPPWKMTQWFKNQDSSSNSSNTVSTSTGNTIHFVIKDGTIFFFLQGILWIIGVYSFAGTKLILNLREVTDTGAGRFPSTATVGTLHTFQVHIPEVLP
ncbi:hypothetical protein GGU10DRAFT_336366 [Lentinula aff. detonsa]|uniref:DUF6533 domain-containing protein n=1 Tax=Lentinula aff. detonsa TaxID=2804958 RepID=A0AA38KDS7_9AGAR|nr:hypothetical protein GGU10DRAFT_336366 [Lentinula aff. detonsa]